MRHQNVPVSGVAAGVPVRGAEARRAAGRPGARAVDRRLAPERPAAQRGRDGLGASPGRGPSLARVLGLADARQAAAADRRSYALYLTTQGQDTLRQIQAAGTGHQDQIGASLTQGERIQLAGLLRRLATEQGITEDNLPGIPPRPPLANAQPGTDRPAPGPGPAE